MTVCVSGILLMMSLCHEVSVYEFLPSMRCTDLCHYHEHYYDSACTLGAYHPLLYEKLLIHKLNKGNEDELRMKGKVCLGGFSTVQCGTWSMFNQFWIFLQWLIIWWKSNDQLHPCFDKLIFHCVGTYSHITDTNINTETFKILIKIITNHIA